MRGPYVSQQLGPMETGPRAAVASFTALRDIYDAPQKMWPKAQMEAGTTLELVAMGVYSTTGTPTASVGFGFNCTAGGAPTTILGQTQLAAPGGTTVTNAPWYATMSVSLRSVASGAAGGVFRCLGYALLGASTTPFLSSTPWWMPTTEALAAPTGDVSADRSLAVCWQWGTSNAANTVTCHSFRAYVTS